MKKLIFIVMMLLVQFDVTRGGTEQLRATDITFVSGCDGTKQRYVVALPSSFDPAGTHDVLIALHGHGSDRWQFVRDPRAECRAARDVAARHGMIYVSPDYRARTSWMGPKAEADVVQIIGDLKKKWRVSHVFLCGASMGGMASLTFAALHPELIDGVASMNGTANMMDYKGFSEAIAESFGGSREAVPDEYKKRSAELWPQRFTMAVGMTAGGKDQTVPPQSVERLAAVLKDRGRDVLMIYRPETGHSTSYDDATAIIEYVIQQPTRAPRT